jgi:uracil-DNA glycosylase
MDELLTAIRACTHCALHLPHGPRPVVQASPTARILIIGQAPGSKVHASGVPWQDDSGNRLIDWLGIDPARFYDPALIAMMPMGFCYPGSDGHADKPPRPECAPLWHDRLIAALPAVSLILLVGAHAQMRYLPDWKRLTMTERVRRWREAPSPYFALPHPSWRVVRWIKQNDWFEAEVLPVVRQRVAAVLAGHLPTA